MKFKIIKKEKDGITLKGHESSQKFSWESFNGMFDISKEDKYTAVLKDDCLPKISEIREIVEDAYVHFRALDTSVKRGVLPERALADTLGLGDAAERLQKALNCDMGQAVQFMRQAFAMQDKLLEKYSARHNHNKKSPNKNKHKNNNHGNKGDKRNNKKPSVEYGCSIGDILKAKS